MMKNFAIASSIAARYGKYGFGIDDIVHMINKAIEAGFTEQQAAIRVRTYLSQEVGEHEPFTAEEMAELTGKSVNEIVRETKKANGAPVVMYPKILRN